MRKLILIALIGLNINCKGGGDNTTDHSDKIAPPTVNLNPTTYEFAAQINVLDQAQYHIVSGAQDVMLEGLDRALDFDTTELKMLLYLKGSDDLTSPVCEVVIESSLVDNLDGTYTLSDRTTHCEPCSNRYNAEGSFRAIECNNTTENQIEVGNIVSVEQMSPTVSRLHLNLFSSGMDIYYQFDRQ